MLDDFDVLNDLDQLRSRYDVLRRIGDDGGCAVYAVRGREPDRHYVVKVMPKPGAGSAQARTLHLWQAHTMERLDHPKLMVLHMVHHLQGGTLALAMERRRGRTVGETIEAGGAMSAESVESTLRDVAEALVYLHRRGVVHRGVSLDSILLDRDSGCARLAHFGIPRGGRGGERAGEDPSRGGSSILESATPAARRGWFGPVEPDGRSDLYGLGLVACAMLAGDLSPPERIDALSDRDALPGLDALLAAAPPHLRRAIEGCVQADPRRRWRSAEELLAALDPAAEYASLEERADSMAVAGASFRTLATAASAIAAALADGAGQLRSPRLAVGIPVALVGLVVWGAMAAENGRQPVSSRAIGDGPAEPAVAEAPVPSGAAPGLPGPLEWQPQAVEPERQPEAGPAGARSASEPATPRSRPREVIDEAPRRTRPPPAQPARRPPPPFLLGEELASADQRPGS